MKEREPLNCARMDFPMLVSLILCSNLHVLFTSVWLCFNLFVDGEI